MWEERRWEQMRGEETKGEETRLDESRTDQPIRGEKAIALVAALTFSLSIAPLPSCLRFSLTNSPVIYEQEPSWRWGSLACVHMHFCKHTTQTQDSSAQTHTNVMLKTYPETQTCINIIYFIRFASVVFAKWLFLQWAEAIMFFSLFFFYEEPKIRFNLEYTNLMKQSVSEWLTSHKLKGEVCHSSRNN